LAESAFPNSEDSGVSDLHETWRRLQAIGAGRADWMAPEPPATGDAIAKAERKLKRPLPPAVVALLGLSRAWGWREEGLDAVLFLPPDEIVEQTLRPRDEAMVLEVEDAVTSRVATLVYGPGRTTFARTDHLFFQVDDAPPPGGRPGQVVSIDFEEGLVDVVAESVDEFLVRGLHCLKAQLEGGFPGLAPLDPVAQAAAAAVPVPVVDAATLPPPVPQPARQPLKQAKAKDPLGATLLGIDAWLHEAMPPGAKRFKAGANAKKIRQFLSAEGYALHDALFPLFETVNGQSPQRVPLLPCPLRRCPGLVLRGFEDTARGRDSQEGIALVYARGGRDYAPAPAGVKAGFWRKHWFPFARSVLEDPAHQVTLFVDFEPAPGGTPGQVVLDFVRSGDVHPEQGDRHVVAPSLQAYFDGVLAAMRNGELVYRADQGVAWATA
jgi:cell wall assembly regulator SMI1